MKKITILTLVSLLSGFYNANGQKTVDGVRFSTCLNNEGLLPWFYKDKYLVLDFWATWCGPCIASFPKVSALQAEYGNNPKIVFAAITTERKNLVDSFFHRRKNMMPGVWQLIDDSATTWQYFDVTSIPRLLVFAPSGKIVFSGRAEDLSGCMDTLLKGADMYKEPVEERQAEDKWRHTLM